MGKPITAALLKYHQENGQERLAAGIKQRFILNPIAEQNVLCLMNAWASMRII